MALHPSSSRGRGTTTWWIGILFAIGSLCFLLGPFPGFLELVGSAADGTVFFVGSIFFTSAAFLQWRHSDGRRPDRDADPADRHRLLQRRHVPRHAGRLRHRRRDRLVWFPEAIGSACFLISGVLAYLALATSAAEPRSGGSR